MSDPVLIATLLSYVAGAITIAAVVLAIVLRRIMRLRDEIGLMGNEVREEIARRNGPGAQEDHIVLKELSDHVKALRQTVAFSDQKLQDLRLQLRDLHADMKDRLAQSSFTLRRTLMDHERLMMELLAKAQSDHRSSAPPVPGEAAIDGDAGMQDGAGLTTEEPETVPEPFRRTAGRPAEQV